MKNDPDGYIKLTTAEEILGQRLYERHTVLSKLFMNLGVDEKTATEDACRIEHYMNDKTFDAIKAHMNIYWSHAKGSEAHRSGDGQCL